VAHLYFFSTHRPTLKKSKRATKPTHQDRHEMTTNNHDRKEGRSANRRLAKKRVQWLNEVLCFVSSSVMADSLVLRNPLLRQAPKRYTQL